MYPSTLPAPMIAGYELNPDEPTLRTPMDAGTDRVRHRFTAVPNHVPVKWRFTQAQMAVFDSWHKYSLLDGSAWFSINLANGLGVSAMDARFNKSLKKILSSGMLWDVQGDLEVRALPVLNVACLLPYAYSTSF